MARGTRVYTGRRLTVDFELDRDGIAEIAVGPHLKDAVRHLAEHRAKPYAISISPVRKGKGGGTYIRSFRVKDEHTVIAAMCRVAARLYNTAPHAAAVEFGNKHAKGQRILGRTVDFLHALGAAEGHHQRRPEP